MKYNINMPRLDWLIGASRIGGDYNRYFGSAGTDGELGFFGKRIFNYSVRMEKAEESELIIASVYGGMKSFESADEAEIEEKAFEAQAESIPLVKAWLEEKCADFYA